MRRLYLLNRIVQLLVNNMSEEKNFTLFVGALITSVIGGALVLFSDFGGTYNEVWYGSYYTKEWWYLNITSEAFALILAIIIPLFFCSFVSLKAIINKEETIEPKWIQYGFYSAAIATAVSLIGGLIFAIIQIIDEPNEWWFDTGFFAGWIAGGLTTLLFYLIKKNIE